MTRPTTLLPSFAVAASGLMWGVWWLPLRALEGAGFSGNWANVAIFVLAAVVTLPIVRPTWVRQADGHRGLFILALLSGVSICLWNYSLIIGDIVRVTLLFYLSPVWATLFSFVYFRESVRGWRVASVVLGLAGAAVLIGIERFGEAPLSLADLFALGAGIMFSLMTIYSRTLGAAAGGWQKTFLSSVVAAGFAVLLVAVTPSGPIPAAATVLAASPILLLCMIWQVPLMWLILWGSGHLESGRVAILLLLELVSAVVSAAILTDEPFGWREIIGCVLILGAGLIEGVDELRRSRPLSAPAPA